MSEWDIYESRINARGKTKREAVLNRELRLINKRLPDNLSYKTVQVDDLLQDIAVINSDNFNEKTIFSMPGEDIRHGALVFWEDNYWLITERDATTTVDTRAKMVQCNHLLKWVSDDGIIHEQWCVVEDGTKYMTGEYEDRNFVVTRGDSRIMVTIARNAETIKFNRQSRFLIDDPEEKTKLSYALTKPLKVGSVYNNNGVYKFILQEVVSTDDDNHELGIADYYKHYPKDSAENMKDHPGVTTPDNTSSEKRGWL